MRFNKQELFTLASQPSNRFDKEGPLVFYEVAEGIPFDRGEGRKQADGSRKSTARSSLRRLACYGGTGGKAGQGRWCRLRGNLLFYQKSAEAWSEPAGVLVLDVGDIRPDPPRQDRLWAFTLVMTSGGDNQRLGAASETDRDAWISALHSAAYSTIRMRMSALQKQLQQLRNPEAAPASEPAGGAVTTSDAGELPYLELSVSCDNLRCDGNGWPPSTRAVLYQRTPPSGLWLAAGGTECVPHCSNPQYLVSLALWHSRGVNHATKLRLVVYEVRDAVTSTQVVLGAAEVDAALLLQEPALKRRLCLATPAGVGGAGFVTLATRNASDLVDDVVSSMLQPRGSSNPQSPTWTDADAEEWAAAAAAGQGHRRTQSLPPRLMLDLGRPSQGWIGTYFVNSVFRTYRFHSGLGGDIVVHESMLETRLSKVVPAALLRLWIRDEKDLVRQLVALGGLTAKSGSPWQQRLLQLLERHFRRIGDYTQALQSVDAAAALFRRSADKDKAELQYCPVNLHLQRLWVQNSSLRKQRTFDWCTVGAFTAIPHGFKGGGLLKLLRNFENAAGEPVEDWVTASRRAVHTGVATLRRLRPLVRQLLALSAGADHAAAVCRLAESLVERVRRLHHLIDPIVVDDALSFYEENGGGAAPAADFSLLPLRSMAERLAGDEPPSDAADAADEPPTDAADAADEAPEAPQPLEPIRQALEASLLTMAGKLQVMMKLYRSRNNNNGGGGRRQQLGPLMTALLDDYDEQRYGRRSGVDIDGPPQAPTKKKLSSATLTKIWAEELTPCLTQLLASVRRLVRTLRLVHAVQRLKQEPPRSATAHSLQHRRDVCFSQALTAAVTLLVARLCCGPVDADVLVLLTGAGLLLNVEGLLTPYRNEAGMWSDMAVAVDDLAAVEFVLVPAATGGADAASGQMPTVHGCRDAVRVDIAVPSSVLAALPKSASVGGVPFRLVPVFFNVAVNEQALLAEKFGDMSQVHAANAEAMRRLDDYHQRYGQLMAEFFPSKRGGGDAARMPPLADVLSELRAELAATAAGKIQNVAVLRLAETAVRRMKGLRVTCCKSAKDRTGMGVTLEQARILSEDFDLAAAEFDRALDCMRSQGTRRENTFKNVGVRKFAFNRLQLMAFPAQYRPPAGTFGNVQS